VAALRRSSREIVDGDLSSRRAISRSVISWALSSAISSRSGNHRYRPDGGTKESLDIPPPWRNQRFPTAGDTPQAAAASSLDSPSAILSQNRRSLSRRTGGRPGDRIAGRPVTVVIHPAGRPIRTSTIKVLRRPVESATAYLFLVQTPSSALFRPRRDSNSL